MDLPLCAWCLELNLLSVKRSSAGMPDMLHPTMTRTLRAVAKLTHSPAFYAMPCRWSWRHAYNGFADCAQTDMRGEAVLAKVVRRDWRSRCRQRHLAFYISGSRRCPNGKRFSAFREPPICPKQTR